MNLTHLGVVTKYQTIEKGNLKKHLPTHKDCKERSWLRCKHCDFKTTRKVLYGDILPVANPQDQRSCQTVLRNIALNGSFFVFLKNRSEGIMLYILR